MHQQPLPLITDFERATAEQLAWCNGKDEPTEREYVQAVKLAAKWNKKRRLMGLRAWV